MLLRPYLIGTFDKDRTRVSRRRQDTLRRLALRPVMEGMEARIAPATRVWSGAVDTLWSTPGNWDVAPSAGDDLVFPNTATGFTSSNDLTAGTNFKSITISGSGYTLSGNALSLTDGLSATYTSGTSDDNIATDIGAGAVSVASGGTLHLGGALSGAAGLTLTGGGILALSATNTYSGSTVVNAGNLRVDGSIPGVVSVNGGATLSGHGTTGDVSATGATVSPGNATPGTLQVASATFNGASTFSVRLDGNTPGNGAAHYDRLTTSGNVTLGNATLSLTLGGGYVPASGDALVLVDNTGTNPVGGTFNGLPEGSLISLGAGKTFRITYQGGTGNDVVLNFVQDSTTTLTSSVNPSVFGQSTTFTATVTAAVGTPTGTVTFMNGATALGTGTLSGGVATLTTAGLVVGGHSITAVYNGDLSNNPSTSSPVVQTVNQASTTTSVTAAPNPSVFGQSVTFTATVAPVAPGTGTPSGTVSFFDGATLLGTRALNGAGQATFTGALGVGAHSVTAVYGGDAGFTGSTSPVSTQTVNQAATATTVTAAPNPSVFGQAVTFTATVTAVAPGAGTPTGTVSFFDGATLLGTGALNGAGQASFTTTALGLGSHAVTAIYGGDADFTSSISSVHSQVVNQAATTTAVTVAPNPSVFGQAVTFTATVTAVAPGTGTPTGTVTFMDGATALGTGTLSGGVATFTTAGLVVGGHSITAVYGGDVDFTGSTSPGLPQTVNQAATTTTVAAAPNPSVFGQSITFTATVAPVAPGAGTPSGTVTFFDGAALLGTGTLSSGQATFTTSALGIGAHAITAVYGGDADFTGSISPVHSQVVNQAVTTTAVVAAPNPSVFGQMVTITATVAPGAPGAGTPTGTVSFFDGATLLGTGTLNGAGQASLTTSALGLGSHAVTAVYGGDADFTGSISPVHSQVVNQASVNVTVVGSPSPSAFGQSVTFTATVTAAAPGAGAPTGTVSFFDGATLLGTGSLNGSGQATFSTSALTLGIHAITAAYNGDVDFQANTSPAFTQVVGSAATTTSLAGSVNPTVFGQSVTFTAVVSPAVMSIDTPTGTVDFYDGATLLGSATLDGTGTATFTTSTLSVGGHSITAVYAGDVFFQTSTSPVLVQGVNRAATAATIGGSGSPTLFGQPVTITTTVSAVAPGAGVPAGTVRLLDGATVVATSALDSTGTATFVVTTLSVGSHNLSIAYLGDAEFNPTTSSTLVQQVNQASTGTALTSSSATSVSGQSVTLTATVTPVAPAGGVPTGTVAFFDGVTPLGTVALDASGVAQLTLANLGVGVHAITAVYAGDPAFSGSTSPALSQTVNKANSAGTLTATVGAPVAGQPVTFVFTVAAVAPGAGLPTGNVTFFDGATALGTAPLSGGIATFTTTDLAVGSHSITAVYAGNGNFNGVTSAPLGLTVAKEATVTTIAAPLTTTVFGQWIGFTATVSAVAPGGVLPAGTVTFFDGATPLGTVPTVGGVATFIATSLTVGGHSITAVYAGGARTLPSSSSAFNLNVVKNNAVVSVTAENAVFGRPTLVTATLSAAAPGAGKPTNVVNFLDNNVVVASAWVVNGVAQTSLNLSPGGSTHTLTVAYLGDNNYNPVVSTPLIRTVAPADTTTGLVTVPVQNGIGTWLVAAVTPSTPNAGVAAGTVTFSVDGVAFSNQTLVNGWAMVYLGPIGVNHTYTARYNGNSNLKPSTSPQVFLGTGALRASARPMAALAARGGVKANGYPSALGF